MIKKLIQKLSDRIPAEGYCSGNCCRSKMAEKNRTQVYYQKQEVDHFFKYYEIFGELFVVVKCTVVCFC